MMEDDIYKERIKSLMLIMQAIKTVKKDSVPFKIEEGLYLGSLGAANNKSGLKSLNITHILTVACSLNRAHPNDFIYKTVEVLDKVEEPISQKFDECFEFIEGAKASGGGVLVHCFAGKSRSVTVTIAYLMFKYGMGLSEAFDHVKTVRSIASPNPGFMSQLKEFERSLQGTKIERSTKGIAACRPKILDSKSEE